MKRIIFFTGAGISAESGLKTFRDEGGLWEGYKVEDVATPMAWRKDPTLVLDFYNARRRAVLNAEPNEAHRIIAQLQIQYDVVVITQNIDDLHERAGSKQVVHLHGEIFKMRSSVDETLIYPVTSDMKLGDLAPDGAQLRPHIVWFHEAVPMMEIAYKLLTDCDAFVVVGSSLQVYPAASLVDNLPANCPLAVIDKKIPPIRRQRVLCIQEPATTGLVTFSHQLVQFLKTA